MKKIISTLQTQGAPNAGVVFNAILKSGLATKEATARNTAALLVALTAPAFVDMAEYTLERLNAVSEEGATFGEALRGIFQAEPHNLKVSQIAVCTNYPWMRVSSFNGDLLEFTDPEFSPQAIRSEVIFSGGVISAVSMKLNGPATTSGWSDPRPEED